MFDFEDQVVLVTGGGSGIGAATCAGLVECGAKVFVTDINGDAAKSKSLLAKAGFPNGVPIKLLYSTLDPGPRVAQSLHFAFRYVQISNEVPRAERLRSDNAIAEEVDSILDRRDQGFLKG